MEARYGSGRMSARAAKSCASLMNVGPSSAKVQGQSLGAAAVALGDVGGRGPEEEKPAAVTQEGDEKRQEPAEDRERAHAGVGYISSQAAMPSSSRKPQVSVNVVTKMDEATAGSTPGPLQQDRDERAREAGDEQIAREREEDHHSEAGALPEDHGDHGHDHTHSQSVHQPDQQLLGEDVNDCSGRTRPSASRRTVTASAWVPALPPIPAMIGIQTASVTSRWIVSWNR